MQHIDSICKKYGVEYLDKHYKNLLDSDSKIHQGSRHDSLIRIASSILFRHGGNGITKPKVEQLKSTFIDVNNNRCIPRENRKVDQESQVQFYTMLGRIGKGAAVLTANVALAVGILDCNPVTDTDKYRSIASASLGFGIILDGFSKLRKRSS